MTNRLLSFASAWVLAGSLGWAAPPTLEVPPEVTATTQYLELLPKTDAVSVTYVGRDGIEPIPANWLNNPVAFRIDTRGLPVGRYRFVAVAAGKTGEQARADFVMVVGTPPVVVPPVPPTPPVPPSPVPSPGVGFRVLILEESNDREPVIQTVVKSAEVQGYLDSRCVKGADGKTPEWRIFDDDLTPDQTKLWAENWRVAYEVAKRDALVTGKQVLPHVIVSDGVAGESLTLPKTKDSLMLLLRKYGK